MASAKQRNHRGARMAMISPRAERGEKGALATFFVEAREIWREGYGTVVKKGVGVWYGGEKGEGVRLAKRRQ
jgi:hypothetical protein